MTTLAENGGWKQMRYHTMPAHFCMNTATILTCNMFPVHKIL